MVDLFCRAVSDKKDWRTQPGNGLLNQLVLRPVLRSVVAHNFGDAQPVIGEHAAPPQRLGLSMPEMIALRRDRDLVTPELQLSPATIQIPSPPASRVLARWRRRVTVGSRIRARTVA
jgi:hypothetical protein